MIVLRSSKARGSISGGTRVPLRDGLLLLLAAEATTVAVGFFVLIRVARALGPASFASVEIATSFAGVMLVLVRGGVESIAVREAARRPRLIRPLTDALVLAKVVMAAAGSSILILTISVGGRVPIGVMIAACLVLWPSAMTLDLGTRSRTRLRPIAAIQFLRAAGLGLAGWLVTSREHTSLAASSAAIAETVAGLAFGWIHHREFGGIELRNRGRATVALLRRGLVASAYRLGRVFLFAADVLFMGWMLPAEAIGPYAAARRITLAIAALGLVLPTAISPSIARAWAEGRKPARRVITRLNHRTMALILPASVGLALTATGWMSAFFGPGYRSGGLSLAILAARLPLLLIATTGGSCLIAIRRERDALRWIALGCALAIIAVPTMTLILGPLGAGLAMALVEAVIAIAGWSALHSLGIAPPAAHADRATIVGIVVLVGAVFTCGDRPVWLVGAVGAVAYAVGRALALSISPKEAVLR